MDDRSAVRRAGLEIHHPVAGGVLAAMGLASLVVTGLHLTAEHTLYGIVFGILPPGLISVGILLVGGWLATTDVSGAVARRAVGWTVAGAVLGGLAVLTFVAYQAAYGVSLIHSEYATGAAATGGMAAGLVVAAYDARSRRHQATLVETSRMLDTLRRVGQAASRADDREALERAVCEEFAQAEPYLFAWIGEVDRERGEVRARAGTEAAETYLESVAIPLDPTDEPRGPTARAVATGEVQTVADVRRDATYERWRAPAREFGVLSSAAVPLDYEGERFGVLNLYADRAHAFEGREREVLAELGETIAQAIAALQYRDRLEGQTQQLEALNQLLRHDIRNDMTVIMAHAERLREDGSPSDSLDVLLRKVDHVVELTETARDLTTSLRAGDGELEPVDLDVVLRQAVDQVGSSYPSASIAVEDLPAVTVRANDMLPAVFENLLNNAVQHHDGDRPAIEVGVATGEGTVTVRVADDGPGIPDAMKERVFEHGERGPGSSGTGLGLYLVETLVDRFGGDVSVADNDPRGTVVAVTLERA